jgi:hypothetical protein
LQSSLGWVLSSALGFSPHPPVSVYGTDQYFAPRAAFLGSMGLLTSLHSKVQFVLPLGRMGLPLVSYSPGLQELTAIRRAAQLPFSVPARFNAHIRCRNINLLSIAYASRPRLRVRLTPGGLTWPGKPWVYGEGVSHSFYRYSLWHNLSSALQ